MRITKIQTPWAIDEPSTGRPTNTLMVNAEGGDARAEVVRDQDGSSIGICVYSARTPLRRRFIPWAVCTIEYELPPPKEEKGGKAKTAA